MTSQPNELANQLLGVLTPHLDRKAGTSPLSKGVTKSLRRLAKQLTKEKGKSGSATPTKEAPSPKKERRSLASELTTLLHPYIGSADQGPARPTKTVTKSVKRLAAQLVKQRHKQAKQSIKTARRAAKKTDAKSPKPISAPARPTPPTASAHRPAAAKRPTPKPVPAASQRAAPRMAPPAADDAAG